MFSLTTIFCCHGKFFALSSLDLTCLFDQNFSISTSYLEILANCKLEAENPGSTPASYLTQELYRRARKFILTTLLLIRNLQGDSSDCPSLSNNVSSSLATRFQASLATMFQASLATMSQASLATMPHTSSEEGGYIVAVQVLFMQSENT